MDSFLAALRNDGLHAPGPGARPAALRLGGDWPERAEAVRATREEIAAEAEKSVAVARAEETERAAAAAMAAPEEAPASAARTGEPGCTAPDRRERAGADPDLALQPAMAVTARTPMAA